MPIPRVLAIGWFFGTVVEAAVAGLLLGLIVRRPKPSAAKSQPPQA